MVGKVDDFLEKLEKVKKRGANSYQARCPAHRDKVESLSIEVADDKILAHCHAGCEFDDIVEAVGLTKKDFNLTNDNFTIEGKSKIEKTYDYENEKGDLIFQVVRKTGKNFRQRQPDGNGGWNWNLKGVDKILYNLPNVIQAIKDDKKIYLVEGEKDADNLIDLGLTATTKAGGAKGWKNSYTGALKGASVVIIPDNDEPGREYANKAGRALQKVAQSVKILDLPELQHKQDVTDWLNMGFDKDDLLEIENKTDEFEPVGLDFDEFAASPMAEAILEKEKRKGKHYKFIAESELLYIYNEQQGYWKTRKLVFMRKTIRGYLKNTAQKFDKNHYVKETLSAFKSILLDPENENLFNVGLNPDKRLINTKSGMLDYRTGIMNKHNKNYYSQFQIPVKYDPEATCPLWEKSLKEWIPEKEARLFLQEYVGYSLIPDTSFQKLLILYGEGSNGKSTLLNVLIKLFGQENLSSLPLSRISQRFQAIRLKDKLVNICSDISSKYLKETGILKGLVTGDVLNAEIKFGGTFEFNPVARLIFSANELPKSSDQTRAWYRRLEIIKFPNTFCKDDPKFDRQLDDKLIEELSGIFNWALEGLKRLKRQDHFTESELMKQAKADYEIENDNITAFIEYETTKKTNSYEIGQIVYQHYKNYCSSSGLKPKSRHKFTAKLKEMGYSNEVKRFNKQVKRCYVGFKLNN